MAIRKSLLSSHAVMELIVFCSNLCAREPSLVWKTTLRSSAKRIILTGNSMLLKMSLIATRKSVPLQGEPCGIMLFWVCMEDNRLATRTWNERWAKKLSSERGRKPRSPYLWRVVRMWCHHTRGRRLHKQVPTDRTNHMRYTLKFNKYY